jgi:RNA-directed DNA polymerase
MEDRQLFPTEAGTPQGGIISPTLANLVLDGLEAVFGRARYINGKRTCLAVNYVRYADDFVVTGRSKELLEQEVMPIVEEFMRERGLTLSPEKTKITHIDEGFDFLGQNIRKYNGKLLIKPSKANVATFLGKVRTTIKGNKAVNQRKLIQLLNPMILGWANYHRHVVSSATFAYVDHEIWKALWRWAARRHSQKGMRWIRRRYFHAVGNRSWVFAEATGELFPDGKPILKSLRYAVDTPIRRHRPIKREANPFDPQWEMYFEERIGLKMLNSLRGRKKLIRLWLDQERRCPICQELITRKTGWHVHHIIRRVDGGKDRSTNLIMVHPNCHNQIHVKGLKVVKPAPARGL